MLFGTIPMLQASTHGTCHEARSLEYHHRSRFGRLCESRAKACAFIWFRDIKILVPNYIHRRSTHIGCSVPIRPQQLASV